LGCKFCLFFCFKRLKINNLHPILQLFYELFGLMKLPSVQTGGSFFYPDNAKAYKPVRKKSK